MHLRTARLRRVVEPLLLLFIECYFAISAAIDIFIFFFLNICNNALYGENSIENYSCIIIVWLCVCVCVAGVIKVLALRLLFDSKNCSRRNQLNWRRMHADCWPVVAQKIIYFYCQHLKNFLIAISFTALRACFTFNF